jgi:crotonobetainyl-CoA:carnitine CoA-transferase CaiB-like acyl-CoA transferase
LPGIKRFEDGTPAATAPTVGQHTAEVLGEYGYDAAQIAGLAKRGVIAVAKV